MAQQANSCDCHHCNGDDDDVEPEEKEDKLNERFNQSTYIHKEYVD